ncbi:MAG: hypothetical protein LC808_24805 [Actinobacteria bacterium]|nr:hypothetical protein [Actinomycetota bacterium]
MARGDTQTNIRLPPDRYAVLEAAAFVHRVGTPAKLAQQLVDDAVDRYAKLDTVNKALEARREQAATEEGKLSHLSAEPRRKASKGESGAAGA